jgi:hypothetical protein
MVEQREFAVILAADVVGYSRLGRIITRKFRAPTCHISPFRPPQSEERSEATTHVKPNTVRRPTLLHYIQGHYQHGASAKYRGMRLVAKGAQ